MKPNRLYMYRGYLIFCGEYRIYFIQCGEKLSIFGGFLEWPFYTTKIVFPITLYLIWLRTKLIVRSVQIPAILRRSPKGLVSCNFQIYTYQCLNIRHFFRQHNEKKNGFFFCAIKIKYSKAKRRQVQQNYKHVVCSNNFKTPINIPI